MSKTRKKTLTTAAKTSKIVLVFLQMLNTIKLYHWRTFSYAQHKATDELYSKLNENIDSFVEIMLGKTGGRVNLTSQKSLPLMDFANVKSFAKQIDKYKQFVSHLHLDNSSDLANIRDEILGNLNQFTYLLTFK